MILDRLQQYLCYQNVSFNKFEISLGVSHGSISNAYKRKKNIGSNVIENILKTYPDISAEWLLRGEGQMLLEKTGKVSDSKSTLDDFDMNELLIDQSLRYFKVNTKNELSKILNQADMSLEDTIIKTWEDKYGQELKSIHRQLMILFKSRMDSELSERQNSSKSKTV